MLENKILIVEDEAIISMEIQDSLQRLGYTITDAVYTGEEAIKSIGQSRPDLILMDIKLDKGDMDGIDTARYVRCRYNIPVVYITAYSDEDILKEAKESYPYGYILKPFKEEELQTTIEIALYNHRAKARLQQYHNKLEIRVIERASELLRLQERLIHEKKQRKISEEILTSLEKEVSYLSSHFLMSQENERKRIAQHLHDGIGHILQTIQEDIEQKAQENFPLSSVKVFKNMALKIEEAALELQKVIFHLNPSNIKEEGLIATINWYCDEFQKKHSQIHIIKEINIKETDLTEHLKTVTFRVLHEAMDNVAHHSEASLVHVKLNKEADKFELIIQDNGKGFDSKISPYDHCFVKGMGLSSIREMIELSGGCLVIESIKDQGTTVKALWYTQ